jgi:hypothetical protein
MKINHNCFLSTKVHIHGSDMESLYKVVPRRLMPAGENSSIRNSPQIHFHFQFADYGGSAATIKGNVTIAASCIQSQSNLAQFYPYQKSLTTGRRRFCLIVSTLRRKRSSTGWMSRSEVRMLLIPTRYSMSTSADEKVYYDVHVYVFKLIKVLNFEPSKSLKLI